MPRRVRINEAGFHHIINRGVEKRTIFKNDSDKDKFLDIVCKISNLYDFTIHAYSLMNNHYHLLVENKRDNLSDGMRSIILLCSYFNKNIKSRTSLSR